MDLNFAQFITFFLLTLSMLSLWLPKKPVFEWVWMAFLAIAVISGVLNQYINHNAIIAFILMGLSCYYAEKKNIPVIIKVISILGIIGFSIAIIPHALPGFDNPKIISGLILSPDAAPYNKSLNFDKTVFGIFLMYFGHRLVTDISEFKKMVKKAAFGAMITMGAILFLSLAMGYAKFDPKFPQIFFFWAWTNLFFTCVAEEGIYRGFLQRKIISSLKNVKHHEYIGLVISSLLFGLLHFEGGINYIFLASVAGLGYGFVYLKSGKIEAVILTHFILNTLHLLFFTYPALASKFG